jgi:hypothetical protein
VTFSFGTQTTPDLADAAADSDLVEPGDIYRLEVVRAVGASTLSSDLAALMPGSLVGRSEIEATRPAAASAPVLQGSLDVKLSSSDDDSRRLVSSWSRSPWRVALVLLIAHHPSFWSLSKDARDPIYLGWHKAQPAPWTRLMGRVLRRLYRSRALPASEWDYIAYLEMQPQDVAHVREHLTELRDPKRNRPRAHVAREVELWMTKQIDAEPKGKNTSAPRVSERLRERLGS